MTARSGRIALTTFIADPEPANRILAGLPGAVLAALRQRGEDIELKPEEVLQRAGAPVEHVLFLDRGLAAVTGGDDVAGEADIGVIGSEGLIGHTLALGITTAFHRVSMLSSGGGLRIDRDTFRDFAEAVPELRDRCLRFAHALQVQTGQIAVCNARHKIEERLARWLLAADEGVGGGELAITHERLARALGVRRAGVTLALHELESTRAIRSTRARLSVLDRGRLTEAACGCHAALRRFRSLPCRASAVTVERGREPVAVARLPA